MFRYLVQEMIIQVRHNIFLRTNNRLPRRQSIWFFHGFGDSGLAYNEVFQSAINQNLNIYILDLPGFGVTPVNPDYLTIKEQASLVSTIIKEETSDHDKVNIVAHSLGALIGTWVCRDLGDRINYYFNIKGNLTEADSYFSSKPLKFKSAEAFSDSFKGDVFEMAKKEERYKRYYSSLRFADPEGMRNWSFSSQEHIKNNQCGIEFKELGCNKLYVWGDLDTPEETQRFIEEQEIPNRLYQGVGHWHMIENSKQLYGDIHQILQT